MSDLNSCYNRRCPGTVATARGVINPVTESPGSMSKRYRMYPTVEQAQTMRVHVGQARFVWNLALEQCRHARMLSQYADQKQWNRQLAEARKEIDWLSEGSSSVQQAALRDLRQAFRNWWGNPAHFGAPSFRSRRKGGQGFVIRDLTITKINHRWAEVTVPKCGRVRFRLSRPLGDHKSARVTLDRSGRWHVSFVGLQTAVEREPTGAVVGVDRGVTDTIATSDGARLSCPGLSERERARKKRLQRKMARQVKGSNRREVTKRAIAKLDARESDRRKDFVEKTSTWLVRDHDLIVFEDLRVRNMMASASGTIDQPGRNVAQKRGLNRAIAAQGWTMLHQRTQEKAEASEGVCVVDIPAAFTSQRCSVCGHTEAGNRRGKRFKCQQCGRVDDADVNAGKNILAAGLVATGRGGTAQSRPPCETSTPDLEVAR